MGQTSSVLAPILAPATYSPSAMHCEVLNLACNTTNIHVNLCYVPTVSQVIGVYALSDHFKVNNLLIGPNYQRGLCTAAGTLPNGEVFGYQNYIEYTNTYDNSYPIDKCGVSFTYILGHFNKAIVLSNTTDCLSFAISGGGYLGRASAGTNCTVLPTPRDVPTTPIAPPHIKHPTHVPSVNDTELSTKVMEDSVARTMIEELPNSAFSKHPTHVPTKVPTESPHTKHPTRAPTRRPTHVPTKVPTEAPHKQDVVASSLFTTVM